MDTSKIPSVRSGGHHPLMILAALAVVLFCMVGTAAIMGWLPSSNGSNAGNRQQLTEAERVALASGMQQQSQPGVAVAPQYAPAPQAYAPAPGAQQYLAQPAYPAQQVQPPYPVPQAQVAPAPAPVREAPRKVSKPVQLAEAEPRAKSNWCSNCGNVESVRAIKQRAQGSGIGAAGGAILGGLLGNQVGGGHGKQLATVAGAVGGAVVGNQVEGNMKASESYEIRVRLDDGTLRTFHQSSAPDWRTGERVKIVKGRLRRA
ncbi:MAG TPA: glycine zipper 2TM domain-containing protein [Telluria sp.]|nr:glycine zipper 2TM domain-containing protein [Telluria sp.]